MTNGATCSFSTLPSMVNGNADYLPVKRCRGGDGMI